MPRRRAAGRAGEFIALGPFKQPSGKIISAWAVEGDFDLEDFKSNLFTIEWPPRSGRMRELPEADRADWFAPQDATRKITKGQIPMIAALLKRLRPGGRVISALDGSPLGHQAAPPYLYLYAGS